MVLSRLVAPLLVTLGATATAQQGPGLGNLGYAPSELFQPASIIKSPEGHGNCAMVGGYLMLIISQDGGGTSMDGGIEFWDVSNPHAPKLFRRYVDQHTYGLREGHGFAFSYSYPRRYLCAQATRGVQFWDVTDPGDLRFVTELQLPGINAGDYDGIWWLFWQAPYVYAAGVAQGLFIIDASDPTQPQLVKRVPTSQLAGLSPSQVFAVGDLLVLTKSKAAQFVTMDIGDPLNPRLLSTITGATGYSHLFAAGKIFTSGGDGAPVQMSVHAVTHDGQMAFIGRSNAPGFSNGGYGSYQDGVYHTGMSNAYAKFDVATQTLLGQGTSNLSGRDEDFGYVLGNLVWVGDDHAVGSALIVHDTAPDSHGADVTWVHPADGADGVPLTARIGVSMSDNVDLESVDATTFRVRPRGGQALPGKYSAQLGLVNFCPDQPLQPDTIYDVEINGIKDLVGNGGGAFRSSFSTYVELGGGGCGGPVSVQAVASGRPYGVQQVALGGKLYVDRDYSFTSVPSFLLGRPYVQTANDDKSAQGTPFLSLCLGADSRVYVLFHDAATVLPAWLQDWNREAEQVATLSYQGATSRYDVFWRDFPAGPVQLGGNANAPMAGSTLMYVPVIEPHGPTTTPPGCSPPVVTPVPVNTNVVFTAPPVTGTPPLQFSWDFGDGSPPTAPQTSTQTSHTYTTPGRFPVVFTVQNAAGRTSCATVQVVHPPLAQNAPTASSPIAIAGTRVFTVNPDNDTVTAIDTGSLQVLWEQPSGHHPRTLALSPLGEVWVVNQDDATVSVLRAADGSLARTLPLPRATRPYGIAFAPDGGAAYVSLQATGGLLKLDPASGQLLARLPLEGKSRGIAVTPDSRRVLVTRFVTTPPADAAVVWNVDAATMTLLGAHTLRFDPGPDTENSGRGMPNFLTSLCISPDGTRLLVPSKKDNLARGLFRSDQPLTFESRVRTICSQIDLTTGREDTAARLDLNDRDMAQTAVYSPLGDLFLIATQGTNTIEVFDAATRGQLASLQTGRSPQGMVFDPTGSRLFVHDFMSRTVSVFDTADLVDGAGNGALNIARIPTVANEALSPQELLGKRIFYNAADRRMNRDGYLSCASCHLDGLSDGQIWDFTQTGEGLRNTIPLLGRAGLGHGRVHWTANFDEIQDFENDIRDGFGGAGFLLDPQFEATRNPLGNPKAGLSPDLDALAAYVTSLDRMPESPFRQPDGSLTPAARRGLEVFQQKGCTSCHSGPNYTDGVRHDVGTLHPGSGLGIGRPLPGVGIETPTLRALWLSPPYLHDGSARSLDEVLRYTSHTGTLTATERRQLVAYLLQIE